MKFSEFVTTKEDFEKVVLDPEEFIKDRGLSAESELQVLNISSIMNDALKVNPVSLSDLSDTYAGKFSEIDSMLDGAGVAAAGFTDHFTKNYTNSGGSIVAEMVGFDPSTIKLDSLTSLSKLVK
ncbi:hypothetical protein [Yoonia sediminilitoris]|uniref:Uncharacterized protein n=1 Tax=Yoonia sediminilitoris TaxID=1286148 RepID=A0A2T6KF11_9RHOB|nr:hypothetical protein [Yoonia sediminilitoris]PUB13711.1 hypothetical protein C8N45_107172 [Yoonia sediminilitoris]RCW94881.1 hypothetical protein DFP92_107172 [Yoonia sediminilitoris]